MTEPTQPVTQPRELGIEGVEIEPDEKGRRRIRMPDGGICYPDETLAVGEMASTEKASEQPLPRERGTVVVTDTTKEN